MTRVHDYKFAWPCYLCGFKLPIRHHRRHFKEHHSAEIDITRVCYMCLSQFNTFKEVREHHPLCVTQIFKTRKLRSPKLVLQGTLAPSIRNTTVAPGITEPPLGSSAIDYLPAFENRNGLPEPAKIITLKLRCIEKNSIKPLFVKESQQLIQYLLNNESSIHSWEVKQFVACLSEDKYWYHLIVSLHHLNQFVELAAPLIHVAPFKCMCSGSSSTTTTDDRIIHAHLLAKITNINKFKRQCWNKLVSPDGRRFKMIINIKSKYHLYNTIYYLGRSIKCSNTENSKHHEIRVPLSKTHANLVLLIFRDLLYDNKLESVKNKMALATFEIWNCKNQNGDEYFVSYAEHVISKMKAMNQIVVEDRRLVISDTLSNETITSRKNGGYLNAERWPGSYITVANVLKEADGLDYWMVWRHDKVKIIMDMMRTELQKHHHLAIYVDEENIAIFGDYWRGSFKAEEEKEMATFLLKRACVHASTIIVKDHLQLIRVKQMVPDANIKYATQKNTLAIHQDDLDTALNMARMMYYSEIDHQNLLLQPSV